MRVCGQLDAVRNVIATGTKERGTTRLVSFREQVCACMGCASSPARRPDAGAVLGRQKPPSEEGLSRPFIVLLVIAANRSLPLKADPWASSDRSSSGRLAASATPRPGP